MMRLLLVQKKSPVYGQMDFYRTAIVKKSLLFKCAHIVHNGPDVFGIGYFLL